MSEPPVRRCWICGRPCIRRDGDRNIHPSCRRRRQRDQTVVRIELATADAIRLCGKLAGVQDRRIGPILNALRDNGLFDP